MEHLELTLLGLLLAVVGLTALARLWNVPYPILLVIGGSLLGFVPGLPDVQLDPDLVLLVFLPPLLFNAAYFASPRDMKLLWRPITLNAIGLVVLTAGAVALVAHALVPGMSWAVAFTLGAICAPTDPLAATTIARRLGVPSRLVSVIEGESLVNDGSALVIYRVAVAAAVGGSFDLLGAGWEFLINVAGGIAIGAVVGYALLPLFRRALADPLVGVTLSLAAGFLGYIPAEEIGVSGVLGAVTVGLVCCWHSPQMTDPISRVTGYAFWEVLVFLLNALLFVLVGFQLHDISTHQERSLPQLLGLGAAVSGAVIGCRLLWLNTTPYLIRALDRRPRQRLLRLGWRPRMVGAWSGMRGAVSLAAALALPLDFPERDLVLFLALAVIFATLVLQGLTLPWLIRMLRIEDDGAAEREELIARRAATDAAIMRLEELRDEPWTRPSTIDFMLQNLDVRRRRLAQVAGERTLEEEDGTDLNVHTDARARVSKQMIDTERAVVIGLRNDGTISDEVMHRLERELDLQELGLEPYRLARGEQG
ncbi:Na+/H+ antiporter [Conexibacter sp. JD483]|uniref:Na+/H+ antiporter n=1 Tax=unclassified Conexibacter TaxID=2627773 RepID=UPI00271F7981|nr:MULTISPECIES: Na+/H+ antiporter [unclassified Conexibacter]MDO8185293.1 Na+/H+ antiporter [Conexibacter sp. CPCC 205706]MDO8198339.1 Na+/H+ antiporter [Conexibacter sp. CPCC 205762]MDR9370526.1 Na+/H+ antiporter [Conexibacter sp. JD483]